MDGWVCVFTSVQLQEVEMIRGILDEHQIIAIIVNKQDSVYLFGEIELHVSFDDAFNAKQIIISIGNSE
jgi:Putative prokaryotic signal transducing protein